jgi:hypothetical protein
MSERYRELRRDDLPKRDEGLSRIAKSGFVFKDGCYLLRGLIPTHTNVGRWDFPDRTGYECTMNHIHIDDHVDSDFLAFGISFVEEVFETWRTQGYEPELMAIFAVDESGLESGLMIAFHAKRPNEQWLDENLENYREEAVLMVDSSETLLLGQR